MATVLIIDDDPEFVDMTRLVLEAHGYQVRDARTAVQGLQAVEKSRPDLIILDVVMESLGAGFSLAQQLRAGKLKDIPILMVTSVSQKTGFDFDLEKDQQFMPVDDFLEKPVKPDELLARVKTLLSGK